MSSATETDVIQAMRQRLTSRQESKAKQVIRWLMHCEQPEGWTIYAQTKFLDDFWYKVYFYTPYGVWKSDTGGEYMVTKADARWVIRTQNLQQVTFDALMHNWQTYRIWTHVPFEQARPIGTVLLEAWRANSKAHDSWPAVPQSTTHRAREPEETP